MALNDRDRVCVAWAVFRAIKAQLRAVGAILAFVVAAISVDTHGTHFPARARAPWF